MCEADTKTRISKNALYHYPNSNMSTQSFTFIPDVIFSFLLRTSSPLVSSVDGLILSYLPQIADTSTQQQVILISFLTFVVVYLLEARLNTPYSSSKTRHSWSVLSPSQLHALLVTFLGWCTFLNPDLWSNPINSSSPSAFLGSCIIVGYMLADLISVILHFEQEGVTFLLHAIFSLMPYATCLVTGKFVSFR